MDVVCSHSTVTHASKVPPLASVHVDVVKDGQDVATPHLSGRNEHKPERFPGREVALAAETSFNDIHCENGI